MKQTLLIIALCVSSSILFGVLHNQASARVSLEYFTIGHPPLIASTSPTLMGIAWGVHSTWWVGLILGLLLALAGRAGKWEKRSAGSFIRPLLILFAACGTASVLFGILGHRLVILGKVPFLEGMSGAISPESRPGYMAALWMHTASYTAAAMGGLILAVGVFTGRLRSSR